MVCILYNSLNVNAFGDISLAYLVRHSHNRVVSLVVVSHTANVAQIYFLVRGNINIIKSLFVESVGVVTFHRTRTLIVD